MAIYLDANVIWSWKAFTEPERLAVTILADQLGQEVFVPSIATPPSAWMTMDPCL
jgi:hypothetical protein